MSGSSVHQYFKRASPLTQGSGIVGGKKSTPLFDSERTMKIDLNELVSFHSIEDTPKDNGGGLCGSGRTTTRLQSSQAMDMSAIIQKINAM